MIPTDEAEAGRVPRHRRRSRRRIQILKETINVVNLTRNARLAHNVELAGNGRNRRKGLLGRASLADGEGLWIIPCEAVHTFCMRFAIDLIYLDRQHKVVKTRSYVHPWRLSACLRAHSVLEVAAGVIGKTGTQPGDHLSLEFLN
jgi:uncharacterized protein